METSTNFYMLKIRAWNTGKIYAQYVNSFILMPIQLLPTSEMKWNMDRLEKIDGKNYFRYYEDNTIRDVIGSSGLEGSMVHQGMIQFFRIVSSLGNNTTT